MRFIPFVFTRASFAAISTLSAPHTARAHERRRTKTPTGRLEPKRLAPHSLAMAAPRRRDQLAAVVASPQVTISQGAPAFRSARAASGCVRASRRGAGPERGSGVGLDEVVVARWKRPCVGAAIRHESSVAVPDSKVARASAWRSLEACRDQFLPRPVYAVFSPGPVLASVSRYDQAVRGEQAAPPSLHRSAVRTDDGVAAHRRPAVGKGARCQAPEAHVSRGSVGPPPPRGWADPTTPEPLSPT